MAAEARDRFDLLEIIGSGGMGEVWRARDRILGREVAIKRIHAGTSTEQRHHTAPALPDTTRAGTCPDDAAAHRLAIREARAAAQLNHPHAVRVYDVIDLDGSPCLVMEYVPARSLYDVVRDDGPLAWVPVATIGVAVLDALDAAHHVGVLHRDVKPSNVLVAHDGRVVLTDFGTASRQGVDTADEGGHLVGTPAYLAPERATAGLSLPAGDIWSLGAILYFAVEGRSPYSRASVQATLAAAVTSAPDRYVHAGVLEPVLDAMLDRQPHRRPSAQQARTLLTAAVTPPTTNFSVRMKLTCRTPAAHRLSARQRLWDRPHRRSLATRPVHRVRRPCERAGLLCSSSRRHTASGTSWSAARPVPM